MNAEFRTILKCKPKLLSHELLSIADELVADELVSFQVCEKIKTAPIDNEAKASELMDNVAEQVRLDPAKFKEFADILRTSANQNSYPMNCFQ